MKAVVVHEFGPFEDVAGLENLEIPKAGPGEVVVQNKAVGISFGMWLNIGGKYQRRAPLPYIPGSEGSGVVVEVGEGVTRVAPGDRVMFNVDDGGCAGFNKVLDICCHKMPDNMSFSDACALANSYTTSYGALVRRAKLTAGETLLVHGAAGGVGLAAVEIGKALGARVIGVAGGEAHCTTAKEHGADHVIDHRENDFKEKVREITDGRGVDVVYDVVGGETTRKSISSLAWEGRLLTIGYVSGTIPEVPANLLLLKNASIMGFNLGHFFGWTPGVPRQEVSSALDEMVKGLFTLYEKGHLKPQVESYLGLSQFQTALGAVIDRTVNGKCIIEHQEEDYV